MGGRGKKEESKGKRNISRRERTDRWEKGPLIQGVRVKGRGQQRKEEERDVEMDINHASAVIEMRG